MGLHLMVDIETLSTHPNAAVLSIGACVFELERPNVIPSTFLVNASIKSNQDAGLHISADTLQWWMTQKPEALRAMFEGDVTNIRQALVRLRLWAQEQRPTITHVWANDPDFDCVILSSAARATGEIWPWPFWMNRSVRTIGDLAFPDNDERKQVMAAFRAEGTHHRADDDAVAQAKFVQHCYQVLTMRSFA